jgi:hypothetical protein
MSSNKLLLDSYPLVILPELAAEIGLNEAIVLQQLHYWLQNNKKKNQTESFHEDRWWSYGSYKYWQEHNFPFWSERTIRRVFVSLEKSGLVISKRFNASDWNQEKWYTINYKALDDIVDTSMRPKWTPPSVQNGRLLIESETNAENTTTSFSKKIAKPPAENPRSFSMPEGL